MMPVLPSPPGERPTHNTDLALIFLRWAGLRALLGRGYWLVTNL
jgi:hypothetical protein